MHEIGKAIKHACIDRGLTQTDLENAAGISHSTLYHRMNGRTEFKLGEARKIAHVLGMTTDEFAEYIGV